jgi:hypothetical protein
MFSLKLPRRIISASVFFTQSAGQSVAHRRLCGPSNDRLKPQSTACVAPVRWSQQILLICTRMVGMPSLFWSFYCQIQLSTSTNAQGCTSQLPTLPPQQKTVPLPHCAAIVLIPLPSVIDIVSNNVSSVYTQTNNVFELLILGCLPPVYLNLATCQDICVGLMAKFIQTVNLCPLHEDPQIIEIFHNHADAIVRLILGCFSICRLAQKISNFPRDLILSRLLV